MKDVKKRLVILLGLIFITCEAAEETKSVEPAQWAHWLEWSPCTETCGFGKHFRVRTCTDPSPSGESPDNCGNINEEIAPCYRGPCDEPPAKAVVFTKDSFQKFPAHGTPSRFLMLYLHFKPLTNEATLIHRYRKCKSVFCAHNVLVKISGNQVELTIRNGVGYTKLTTDNAIKLGKWQTIFIQITRRLITIRLNDEFRKVTRFPNLDFPSDVPIHVTKKLEEFDEIDFDAEMILGCDKHKKNAFVGSILKFRHNFKEMSMSHDPDWVGFGAPMAQGNINTELIGSPEIHSRFLGKYYTKMNFEFQERRTLNLEMSIYFMGLDGLVLFNHGKKSGTFMSLALHRGALRFCFNSGGSTSCQKAILMQIRRWYFMTVSIDGSVAELRVDRGRAVNLVPTGGSYEPKGTMLIGGSDYEEWTTIGDLTRVDIGFDGIINDVRINGNHLYLRQSVLFDRNGRVNADGYSLSAHVSEVYETRNSLVTLRCDASLFASKGGVVSVNWIESDQLIAGGPGEKIIEQVPGNPFESALILKENHHHEGIYACIISHNGFRIMTHTFPVLRRTHQIPLSWRVQLLIATVPTIIILIIMTILCCGFWCKRCKGCPMYNPIIAAVEGYGSKSRLDPERGIPEKIVKAISKSLMNLPAVVKKASDVRFIENSNKKKKEEQSKKTKESKKKEESKKKKKKEEEEESEEEETEEETEEEEEEEEEEGEEEEAEGVEAYLAEGAEAYEAEAVEAEGVEAFEAEGVEAFEAEGVEVFEAEGVEAYEAEAVEAEAVEEEAVEEVPK